MRIPRARCLLSRMDGGSLIGSLIQNDDGGLGWAASSEAIEPLVQLSPAFPQPVTFFANCAATNNGDGRSSGHRESGLGLCLKVEPPGRFWCAPPVHRHRDDAVTVLEVADHHPAFDAAAASGRGEVGKPVAIRSRSTKPEPASAPPVERLVDLPCCPNDPAGRKESADRRVWIVGHTSTLRDVAQAPIGPFGRDGDVDVRDENWSTVLRRIATP